MTTIIGTISVLMLLPLSIIILYQWFLAICSLFYRRAKERGEIALSRFLLMIPAHNEQPGIASTLHSLFQLDYPRDRYTVLVIADRCTDGTATVARDEGAVCLERFDGRAGKGAALAWGIQEARKSGIEFGPVVIVDADTLVDRSLLSAFNTQLQAGHEVQQGYNYISNPWATQFTRIIAVSSALRNGRFYTGKTVLGLP